MPVGVIQTLPLIIILTIFLIVFLFYFNLFINDLENKDDIVILLLQHMNSKLF